MSSYEQVCVLPYPREQVWYALTEGELVEHWLPAHSPSLFEDSHFELKGFGAGEGHVIVHRRPREIVVELTWGSIETQLILRLSEIVRGTRVTIEHSGFHGARAWMIAKRLETKVKRLIEKVLPSMLVSLASDEVLLGELKARSNEREQSKKDQRAHERAERDAVADAKERDAEDRREQVRLASDARREREREQVEQILEEQREIERAKLESEALQDRQDREEDERQSKKRKDREAAAKQAELERQKERERAEARGHSFEPVSERPSEEPADGPSGGSDAARQRWSQASAGRTRGRSTRPRPRAHLR